MLRQSDEDRLVADFTMSVMPAVLQTQTIIAQATVPNNNRPEPGALERALMAEFVAQLAPVNALADSSPGFVWRWTGATVTMGSNGGTGTNIMTLGYDPARQRFVAIELVHGDPELNYRVFEEIGNANVVAEWQNWGKKLRLPLFIKAGDGNLLPYSQQVDGVGAG